ncbi:MAG: TetR/AcrR family transcriptional regulator [Spirochaetales bacterium]|nr:TetR/AcrR family transcriptional regulator [Spirochaetales bacterium]
MSRVERKKLAAQSRILKAAEKLFLREDGYDRTTIRDIAGLADVSTGAVYMHFSGKPDIMAALLDKIVIDYKGGFTNVGGGEKTGLEKIEDLIGHFFNLIQQPKFLAYVYYISRLDPKEIDSGIAETFVQRHMQFYELLKNAITEGQKDGSIQKFDSPEIMAFVFLHATHGFIRDITMKHQIEGCPVFYPKFSQDRTLNLLKKMLIAAIAGKPPAVKKSSGGRGFQGRKGLQRAKMSLK